MIKWLLTRPVAVSMFYLGIVILGVISYLNLSVEGQPDTELPQLVVSTSWPNASPEVVQVFLTSPVEEAAAQIEGLEELISSSTRGSSSVILKLNRDTDMEFARLDLNERLSSIRTDLPSGAQQPVINMTERNDTDQNQFMSFNISGPYDLQRLSELFNDYIYDEISSVEGVADVIVRGEREKTLKVLLDRRAMDLYGLVPSRVTSKIAELSKIYETPRSKFKNQEYLITITNSIPDIKTVEDLVLVKFKDKIVTVGDVGTVELGHARAFSLSRLNGNPTLNITVEKEVGASVIQTARKVRESTIAALEHMPVPTAKNFLPDEKLPPGGEANMFRLDLDLDEGLMMQEQLSNIYTRGAWCIGLIIILLLIFLQSVSAAVVITFNIFFSVLITVNFMYYFDVTFNVVTLSGLAIGFGMLVDNAIVVLENIFRHRELGRSRTESAILGVKEIVWAIIAATLTTVAAFLMMIFLEGRLAVTYWPLALSVIFSLSASLFVSFTFTPLLSILIRGSNLGNSGKKKNVVARLFGWMVNGLTENYGRVVSWTLHHKMLLILITASFLFMFVKIFQDEIDSGGFSFFFNRDDRVTTFIRMPEGAELDTADEVIRQFEEPLMDVKGYRDVSVRVFDTMAIMEVSFDSEMLASPFPLALKSKLISIAQGFAGVGLYVAGISSDDNYSSGSTGYESYNSNIRVMGYNYKDLMDYAEKLERQVKRSRRVKTTKLETSRRSFRTPDQTETALEVDREAMRQYDIDISYLMGFLFRNLRMESTDLIKYDKEEMKLEVKFADADDFDIKALEDLVIRTPGNQRIRLADMVSIVERKMPGGIDRKDQQYMVNVRWDYKGSPKRARTYNEAIFSNLELPSGFKAELDYSEDISEDERINLYFVMGLATLVVFMIIAALYESFVDPLVIFLTIPLAFIGVSWIYWQNGKSFDSTAYIGLIILAGIVVNNSILLVSHINDEVRKTEETGLTFNEAVVKACKDRLRPILLTAITTIVGLLPLLEEFVFWFVNLAPVAFILNLIGMEVAVNLENRGLQGTLNMFSSLSRSTVGGLLSATLSTLLVIPVVYTVFFRSKQWLSFRINEAFSIAKPGKPPVDEANA